MTELVNLPCIRLGRLKSSELSAVLGFNGGARLLIACAFRVEREDTILATTRDGHRGLELLRGSRISSFRRDETSGDLEVHWNNECILRLFCDVHDGKMNYGVDRGDGKVESTRTLKLLK